MTQYWEPLIPVKLVMDTETTGHTEVHYPFPGIFDKVNEELIRASAKHGAFPTKMHGYAVILEELDEAWHEIKHGSVDKAKEELIQVAAMCIRFCMDL